MRNSSKQLLVGQVVGQLALLLSIPFLTRLLSQPEMGVYQVALSVAIVLQPVATLRKELLIPVSSFSDAQKHRRKGLSLSIFMSALIAIAGLSLWLPLGKSVADVLFCTALTLVSLAMIVIENAYLIRHGRFSRLALRNLLAGFGTALLQIAAAYIFASALAVALAMLLGRLLATLATIVHIAAKEVTVGQAERRSQRTVSAVLSSMVAAASIHAVVIGSFAFLGPTASAQVGVGQRIGSAPTSLVGQALSQIALGKIAPLLREGKPGVTQQLRRQTLLTASGAIATALALIIGGPLLAGPILGDGWEPAGVIAAIFAVPLSLQLVALPATTLLIPMGRERLLLLLQTIRLVFVLTALVCSAVVSSDLMITSMVTSIVWSLAYVPLLSASFMASKAHDLRYSIS